MDRIFKTRPFAQRLKKSGIADSDLRRAVAEMRQGVIDADLGGDLYKKRVAVGGQGKRGGARTIVAMKAQGLWFFFTDSKRTNAPISVNASSWHCGCLRQICSLCLQSSSKLLAMPEIWKRFEPMASMKNESGILQTVHETARDLHRLGFIDKRRLEQYDALCLPPVPDYDAEQIRALRSRLNLSQPVFAAVLNTSTSTVRQWELGAKHPRGTSLKLLNILERKGLDAVL